MLQFLCFALMVFIGIAMAERAFLLIESTLFTLFVVSICLIMVLVGLVGFTVMIIY